MTLTLAQANAWSPATTLMAGVVLFTAEDEYAVMTATEFDGEPASVVHEI